MKRFFATLLFLVMIVPIVAILFSRMAHAQEVPANIVPKDKLNVPIYGGIGRPLFYESVTLSTSSYVKLVTLPSTGENSYRMFRGIAVRNPDASRSVYICLGSTSSCSSDAMKIPPAQGIALDQVYFGFINDVTDIWGKLDSAGSVTPEITIW